jgi:hypothetical protein
MRFAVLVLGAAGLLRAQSVITKVEPETAIVNDTVTASGEAVDAANVDALFLTNGKDDIEVKIMEQSEKVIKFKIPANVKPGRWALMIRTKGTDPKLLEMPVKLTIE